MAVTNFIKALMPQTSAEVLVPFTQKQELNKE